MTENHSMDRKYKEEQIEHELRLARFNLKRAQTFSEAAGEHIKEACRLRESMHEMDDDAA